MNIEIALALSSVQDVITSVENCQFDDDIWDLEKKPYVSSIESGETKLAILSNEWDFVLKIPFSGCSKDYCKAEMDNYQKAALYGVQKILLETALLHTCANGIKIYIQPKYDCDYADFKDSGKGVLLAQKINNHNSKTTKKALNGMFDGCRINRMWFARVIQLYGKKFTRSLENFTQDCKIGDLHMCNIGWKNNKPVIFDYSGYEE